MRSTIHSALVIAVGPLAAMLVLPCSAQSKPPADPAPCTVAPQPQPCGTAPATSDQGNAAKRFPFPGEGSGSASSSPSPDAPQPDLNGVPQAPSATQEDGGSGSKSSAAKQFPFPGEGDSPSTDTSSSSSSSSSSSDDGAPIPGTGSDPNADQPPQLKDKDSEREQTSGRHILHRINPLGTKLQTPDEREQEDLSVARFYMDSGDLRGAYLRSQDAVQTIPDDPDAHFSLAEVAAKLDKRDEAIAEYNACLKLDASDKEIKESRKALVRLQKNSNSK